MVLALRTEKGDHGLNVGELWEPEEAGKWILSHSLQRGPGDCVRPLTYKSVGW